MPYSTGIITNTRVTGTAANFIAVSSRNLSSATATVVVEIFAVPMSTLTLTPIYVSSYTVPAFSADIREFNIAGNVAYEVQIDNTDPLSVVAFSSYGIDGSGNLVLEQRVLQSEFTEIPAFSLPI